MNLRLLSILCLTLIGYASAQYQDGYEGNVNPYPRSQYDNTENYAPQTRAANSYSRSTSSSPAYQKPKALPQVKAKLTAEEEEAAAEEEKKPSPLELLLANSKFTCSNRKDGYYADNSVNCQVFHYCVGGAKHSWMCPENTVFHQVHLNCVPSAQDICSQSEKYHIVNDYLHKPIEQNYGPNQTVRYHQRYYPEEFLGDPSIPPNTNAQYPASNPSTRLPTSYSNNRGSNSGYNSASYEDESPVSFRASSYSNNNAAPVRPTKPSYSTYPSSYQPQPKAAEPAYKPTVTTKPKSSYSSGGYPVSLISSPQPSRRPSSSYNSNSNENYDDGSYKPSMFSQPAAVRSQPISSYPTSKPVANYKPSFQPYTGGSSSSAYKPSSFSPSKPASSLYPGYTASNTGNTRSSAGYEANSKPYDYSGVTYEEDYS